MLRLRLLALRGLAARRGRVVRVVVLVVVALAVKVVVVLLLLLALVVHGLAREPENRLRQQLLGNRLAQLGGRGGEKM